MSTEEGCLPVLIGLGGAGLRRGLGGGDADTDGRPGHQEFALVDVHELSPLVRWRWIGKGVSSSAALAAW